jgi:hypothetical protein
LAYQLVFPLASMKFPTLLVTAACALLPLGLGSCGLETARSGPPPTRFLASTGTDMSRKIKRLPFEHAWRDPAVNLENYRHIVVRPVSTAFLKTENWQDSESAWIPSKRAYQRRCKALAKHFSQSLDRAFSSPVCVFYKTTDTTRPGTLILEVALTEVRFDRKEAQAGTTPLPASDVPRVFTGLPICAFEARVRDAATGKWISTAADRRGPTIQVLDPNRTTTAKPNEQICDEWSEQLMMSANKELFPTVRRSWFRFF